MALCANLPYYITTPLLLHLLESGAPIRSMTVMIQKEVAGRLCAAPATPEYGAVTLAVQYYAKAQRRFDVAPGILSAGSEGDLNRDNPHPLGGAAGPACGQPSVFQPDPRRIQPAAQDALQRPAKPMRRTV